VYLLADGTQDAFDLCGRGFEGAGADERSANDHERRSIFGSANRLLYAEAANRLYGDLHRLHDPL
jgi:hypothetical protein